MNFLVNLTDFFILSTILITVFTIVISLTSLVMKIIPEKYSDKILDIFPSISDRN